MPIRITGLNSGLDTETIISALVSSYNYKTQKYKKAQTKLAWKQDAWKTLNSKIYSLYNSVGNLRYSSAYSLKSTTVSDTTKLSVSAGTNASNGSYSVHVTSLAKAGYLTGAQLDAGTKASTTLGELGYTGNDGRISLTVGGKTTDIEVSADTKVQDVVNELKEAGVNANYDEVNCRFFVSAKDTGKENDFSLTGADASGTAALTCMGLNVASKADIREYEALAQYSTMSLDEMKNKVAEKKYATEHNASLKSANSYYTTAMNYAKAADEIRKVGADAIGTQRADGSVITEKDFELLKKLVTEGADAKKYVDADGNIYSKSVTGKFETEIKNPDGTTTKVEVEAKDIAAEGSGYTVATDKYNQLLEDFGLKKEKLDKDENPVLDDEGNPVLINDTDAINKFKKNLSVVEAAEKKAATATDVEILDADGAVIETVSLSQLIEEAKSVVESEAASAGALESFVTELEGVVEANEAIIKTNEATLAANDRLTADMEDADVEAFFDKVDYAKRVLADPTLLGEKSGATRVDGEDAKIYVNGAAYIGASNSFSINGITFTASGLTTTEEQMQNAIANKTEPMGAVNVIVNTDTQGIYDKIKDFLTQYNALVNEMTSLYNADSAKGYEPLTDEERDEMSDTEIEKWEEKIKASLLRRDDTLSGVLSTMTNAMAKGVKVNGKTCYLSDFGIKTLGFLKAPKNEHNAYHIDGDEDDVTSAGNADKLMAAIAEDPDTVLEFMKGLATNLYESVDAKMKSTSMRSSYTVYNDKEMASEYSDYTSLIRKWQDRLEKQEEYYYQKFAAMETALSKLNSQTSSLTGLLG